MNKLTTAEFYPAMLERVAHVETLRHGIMTIQLGVIGAVIGQFFSKDGAEIFKKPEYCIPALLLSITILKLLELMAHNLFVKSIRAATELMIIEHADGLVSAGIGYFSFRRQRGRGEYWVSGMMPELLLFLFFMAFCLLARNVPMLDPLPAFIGIGCLFSLCGRYKSIEKIFARKDAIEDECGKTDSAPLGDRLFKMRTEK